MFLKRKIKKKFVCVKLWIIHDIIRGWRFFLLYFTCGIIHFLFITFNWLRNFLAYQHSPAPYFYTFFLCLLCWQLKEEIILHIFSSLYFLFLFKETYKIGYVSRRKFIRWKLSHWIYLFCCPFSLCLFCLSPLLHSYLTLY